jgi:pre-mRNA-processing factor 6
VISSNPTSTSGWIAAARIEELDGKIQEARKILAQACQNFLDSEDVWLEAARLQPFDKIKGFLAQAVQNMPKSKRLWLMAASKETDPKVKSKILKRALEHLPTEVELWKECIEL